MLDIQDVQKMEDSDHVKPFIAFEIICKTSECVSVMSEVMYKELIVSNFC